MKYKVGDKVKIRADLRPGEDYGGIKPLLSMCVKRGNVATIKSSEVCYGLQLYHFEGDERGFLWTEEMFERLANESPSVTKRINDKHNILNGLLNSDGSVDGEKLMEKLASDSKDSAQKEKFKEGDNKQIVRTLSLPSGGYIKRVNSHCEKVEAKENNSEEAKTKGSHYEKAAMQPLEVMQRIMTTEQFEGFLYGCCLKYLLRKDYKGQRESDEYKSRQYAYWLEMAREGRIINPSKDKVPFDYKFSII